MITKADVLREIAEAEKALNKNIQNEFSVTVAPETLRTLIDAARCAPYRTREGMRHESDLDINKMLDARGHLR